MREGIQKLADTTANILKYISLFLLACLSLIIFISVLTRYIFKISIPELIVIQKFAISWLVFLGAAVGVKEKNHLKIDMLNDILPQKYIDIKELIIDFLLIFVMIGLIVVGQKAFFNGFTRKELIPIRFLSESISLGYFNSSFLVGSILMLLFQVQNFINSLFSYQTKEKEVTK